MKNLYLMLMLAACGSGPRPLDLLDAGSGGIFTVAIGGDDLGPCSLEEPCATVNGVLERLPRERGGNVLVNVGPGSFPCFSVHGFDADPLSNAGTGFGGPNAGGEGVAIQGSMATLYSGTISSSTGGNIGGLGAVFATLTDSTKNWAPDELVGKFLIHATGLPVTSRFPIYSNTATTITYESALNAEPVGNAYRVEEQASVLTNSCPGAPSVGTGTDGGFSSTQTPAAILIGDNSGGWVNTVKISNFRLENPSGRGILIRSPGRIVLDTITARSLTNNDIRIVIERNSDGVTISNSTFRMAPGVNQHLIQAHGQNEPWQMAGPLTLNAVVCENGRACLSSTTQVAGYLIGHRPLQNFGLALNGSGGNLIRGMICEASRVPATACIRTGDGDARGWCEGSLSLQSSTFLGPFHADGLDATGPCMLDVWRVTGNVNGYGLYVNFGAKIVTDPTSNIIGSAGDLLINDTIDGTTTTPTPYSWSWLRARPNKCTLPALMGSAICSN